MRQTGMNIFRWPGGRQLILILAVVWVCALAQAGNLGPDFPDELGIGLAVNRKSIDLVFPEAGEIISDKGNRLVLEAGVHELRWAPAGITLGKLRVADKGLHVVSRNAGANLGYRSGLYRGMLRVIRTSNGLTLVNILGLEDYLQGVVPWEVPPGWAPEALKAQAVAARTYTMARAGVHQDQGFDLCATTHCQVYGGASAEHDTTNQAVAETRGEVMLFNGKPITAVYHSSSGGYTENSENVWGWNSPYLQGVPDLDLSPYAVWEKEMAWTDFTATILGEYPKMGYIRTVTPTAYGVSGRISQFRLDGGGDSRKVTGEFFRHLFGLRSTLFALIFEGENGQMLYRPGEMLPRFLPRRGGETEGTMEVSLFDEGFFGQNPDKFRVERVRMVGSGWGHGVGLSQWGSKNMADEGKNYRDILGYYYQEVRVQSVLSAR